LPPYLAAQVRAALKVAAAADEERNRVAATSGFLRARLQEMGFDVGRSDSQIIPVLLGPNEAALRLQDRLCRRGFVVRAIRPPTVPPGTARLRLSVNANLAPEVLVELVDAFREAREVLTTSQAR
jgi:8-amino-7-oxononanoate synthase